MKNEARKTEPLKPPFLLSENEFYNLQVEFYNIQQQTAL